MADDKTHFDFFISPITGKFRPESLPDLPEGHIWKGNRYGRTEASAVLKDIALSIIELRHETGKLRNAAYILSDPDNDLDNAQVLSSLPDGILAHRSGVLYRAELDTGAVGSPLKQGYVLIGDENDRAAEVKTFGLDNFPGLEQNRLWSGDADGRPAAVERISFANLPPLSAGKFWVGNDEGFAEERDILSESDLPDLQKDHLMMGNDDNRPEARQRVGLKNLPQLHVADKSAEDIWDEIKDIFEAEGGLGDVIESVLSELGFEVLGLEGGKIWRGTEDGTVVESDALTTVETDLLLLNARLWYTNLVTVPWIKAQLAAIRVITAEQQALIGQLETQLQLVTADVAALNTVVTALQAELAALMPVIQAAIAAGIAQIEAALVTGIGQIQGNVQAGIALIQSEVQAGVVAIQAEVQAGIAQLQAQAAALQVQLQTSVTAAQAAAAAAAASASVAAGSAAAAAASAVSASAAADAAWFVLFLLGFDVPDPNRYVDKVEDAVDDAKDARDKAKEYRDEAKELLLQAQEQSYTVTKIQNQLYYLDPPDDPEATEYRWDYVLKDDIPFKMGFYSQSEEGIKSGYEFKYDPIPQQMFSLVHNNADGTWYTVFKHIHDWRTLTIFSKTYFDFFPKVSGTPSHDDELANKSYVDSKTWDAASIDDFGESVTGIITPLLEPYLQKTAFDLFKTENKTYIDTRTWTSTQIADFTDAVNSLISASDNGKYLLQDDFALWKPQNKTYIDTHTWMTASITDFTDSVNALIESSKRRTLSEAGTVKSVGLTAGTGITVTGSPVTVDGVFNVSLSAPLQRFAGLTDAQAADMTNFQGFISSGDAAVLTSAKSYTDSKFLTKPWVSSVTVSAGTGMAVANPTITGTGTISLSLASPLQKLAALTDPQVTDITNFKTFISNGDTATLTSAKAYTDSKISSTSVSIPDVITKTNTQSFAYTNTTQRDSLFLDNVIAGSPSSVTLAMRARNSTANSEAVYRHVVSTGAVQNTNYVQGYTFEYAAATTKTRILAHDNAVQKLFFYTPADHGANAVQTSYTPLSDNDVVNLKYLKSYAFAFPNPMTVKGLVIQDDNASHALTLKNLRTNAETRLDLDDGKAISTVSSITRLGGQTGSTMQFYQRERASNGTLGIAQFFLNMGINTGVEILPDTVMNKKLSVLGDVSLGGKATVKGLLDVTGQGVTTTVNELVTSFSTQTPIAVFRAADSNATSILHRMQGFANSSGTRNFWTVDYNFGKQDAAKRVCALRVSHDHYKLGAIRLLNLSSNIDGNQMHWNFSGNSFKFSKIGDDSTFLYITADSQFLLETQTLNKSIYKPKSSPTNSVIIGINTKTKTIPDGKTTIATGSSHIVFNEFFMQFITNPNMLGFIFTNYNAQNIGTSYMSYIDSGGNYYKNSDTSTKFSLRPKTPKGYLDRLRSLKVYSYGLRSPISEHDTPQTRDQKYFANRTLQLGFVASEVIEVFDNITDKTKLLTISGENEAEFNALTLGHKPSMTDEEYITSQDELRPIMSVDYQKMIPYIVLANQELAAEFDKLKSEFDKLKKEISSFNS